jgi:pyruvate formate lyase activating enzyme
MDAPLTGRIFDIQRYCIHDGDGIRTIVFFKGCFMRCRWCCNPESQSREAELMRMPDGKVKTAGRDVTADEVMQTVERDLVYYRRSGGGLTLSGGEVLCQPDFAAELLREAHARGIHTAIESSAQAPFVEIEKLLPHVDVFLMDIKHTDAVKHERFTGKRNDNVLKNAAKVATSGLVKLIIRVPVIPSFNATECEIRGIAEFAAGLPEVKELHLLPYHRYGEGKYAALGREYPMGDAKPPADAEMERFKQEVEKTGLLCRVGG